MSENRKIIRAKDIAEFFIRKGSYEDDYITNLKLQKLLYYAQGFHLALFGKPLFKENIEAWTQGPVVSDVYREYKKYGKNPLPAEGIDIDNVIDKLTDEQINLLNEIWSVFGQYSLWKLRDMVHEEEPWINHERDASVISKKELKDYFLVRVRRVRED